MKNFRQKAVPAVAMLAVASLTLASVTYAWFSSNDKVEVDNIDVNVVETQGGIAISKKANEGYTNKISFNHKDGEETVGDFANYDIEPVSTNGVIGSDGLLKFFKGYVSESDPTNKLKSADEITATDAAKKGYIVMDLYFENQNTQNQDVYFNYTTANILNEMIKDANGKCPISSESVRIAFVNRGYQNTMPTTEAGENWTGGQVSGNAMIIEPNSATHLTQYGSLTGKQEYYGIADDFSGEKSIKPSFGDSYLQKVTTSEIKEHNQKQDTIYFKSTDTDLGDNGFYSITTYTGDDLAKNGYYLKSSIDYVAEELYTLADLFVIGSKSYDKNTLKPVAATYYEESDFDSATYTLVGAGDDAKYYLKSSLNGDDLYAEPTEDQNVLADHQVGEVKTQATYVLYTADDGTGADDDAKANDFNAKVTAKTWNKEADENEIKVAESGTLRADGAGNNLRPEAVVREYAHTPLFTLQGSDQGSTYSWIQVYVWLEGQDIDCLSTISNLDFAVALKFIAYPKEAK